MVLSARKALIAICVGVFIWEVVVSFMKYSHSRIGKPEEAKKKSDFNFLL